MVFGSRSKQNKGFLQLRNLIRLGGLHSSLGTTVGGMEPSGKTSVCGSFLPVLVVQNTGQKERMKQAYDDITSRLGNPLWWDEAGCPRYVPF